MEVLIIIVKENDRGFPSIVGKPDRTYCEGTRLNVLALTDELRKLGLAEYLDFVWGFAHIVLLK